jgi:hypothetical protein
MLNSSDNFPEQQHRLEPLRQLLHKHPFVCFGGLWVLFVILGSMSAVRLVSPGPMEQDASKPTPGLTTLLESKPEQPALTTVLESKPKQHMPLALFGTVAIGCAAGSLFITQALRYSTQNYQPSRRLKTAGTTSRKKRRHPSQKGHPVPSTQQPISSALTYQPVNNRLATTNKQPTQITVLPPEESHPLDRGNENLAEMMDLRKRKSLASLMRGK